MTVDQVKAYIYDLIVQSNLVANQIREAEEALKQKLESGPQDAPCCPPAV